MIKIPPTQRAAVRTAAPISHRSPTGVFASLLRRAKHGAIQASDRDEPDPREARSRAHVDPQGLPSGRDEVSQLSPSGAVEDDSPESDEPCDLDDDRRLDPMTRHLAMPFSACVTVERTDPASGLQERLDLARSQTLEQMFPALVRKAAWQLASDGRSATLCLEIGAGPFDGTKVVIRADLHEVHIELDAPPGIDLEVWKNRLRLRLASQGLIAMIS